MYQEMRKILNEEFVAFCTSSNIIREKYSRGCGLNQFLV
jgi:hypothetical protein